MQDSFLSECKQFQKSKSNKNEANSNTMKQENQTENQEANQASKIATKWISKVSLGFSISISLVIAAATILILVTRQNNEVRLMTITITKVVLDVIPLCLVICPDQTFEFTSRKVKAFFERNM